MKLVSVWESLEYESRKALRRYRRRLKRINSYQDMLREMSDEELKQTYIDWSQEDYSIQNTKQVDELFAMAREVTYRLLGKFHYDVQILGALAATERNMIQMSTGSGKTITLILPVIAHGLTRKGVYVLTVNDYLSERDWEETKPVYDWFGLTSGHTTHQASETEQQAVFSNDVIYCTNSTLGFAYLNSALASGIGRDIKLIERPLYAALIDEVDEILMDDARNPLIIAGPSDDAKNLIKIDHHGRSIDLFWLVDRLKNLPHIAVDEDGTGQTFLDDETLEDIKRLLKIDDRLFGDEKLMHVIYTAVQALFHYHAFTDYIVMDEPDPDTGSRIALIDKATGRLSPGRTLANNLHVFIEIKEGVFSGASTQSTLQITYQVLFNLFETIAGVSGTLGTSFNEFLDIYNTGVVVIPDRFPSRLSQKTHLYATPFQLYDDLIAHVQMSRASLQPVLIGATSDIGAEMLSHVLTQSEIPHRLLISTDKNEDAIVASAGEPGSVVVTTDIMGRGTDIKVKDTDMERGLVVYQVGRRPNSRVERQFAGRAGRQGQPGYYHRMLLVPDLEEMGLSDTDQQTLRQLLNEYDSSVSQNLYNGDLLWNGRYPHYDEIVRRIDAALVAQESSYSTQRVQDFRAYSIIDLVQTALIKQMDAIRSGLKQSMNDQGDEPLIQALLPHIIPDSASRKERRESETYLRSLPIDTIQSLAYQYTQRIVGGFLPKLRDFSDQATQTTQLAGMVKFDRQPEDLMTTLLKEFMERHENDLLFQLPTMN